MRTPPEIADFLSKLQERGVLSPLHSLASVAGGVVTRANAYFLVRELQVGEIPRRFRVTTKDLERVAIVVDGMETAHCIEREFVLPVVKGPEMLAGPSQISPTDLRLFYVAQSPKDLKKRKMHGALKYIARGETENYRTSEDSLKGGIPAQRSNIRSRKPYWYSLSVPSAQSFRIVIPEHHDARYVATLLDGMSHVVLDKLFLVTPVDPSNTNAMLISLNSVLTWCQLELRGRTQLGQGVLETKKSDLEGILVLNPNRIPKRDLQRLEVAFRDVRNRASKRSRVGSAVFS